MDFQGQRAATANSFLSGQGAELQLPPESVVLVRDSGVEFLSPQPLELFAEFDLDLRTGRRSCRTTVVVVGCQRWSGSLWRVSVLFTGEPAGCENLSLAA